jgi:uridine kinase
MQEFVDKDEPFVKERLLTEDAVDHLMQEGLTEKAQLFEQKGHLYSSFII